MKKLIGAAKFAAVLVILVISACGDVGFLLPVENDQPEVVIMSVSRGAVLMPEDTFEVALDYNDEEFFPDRMVIELRDRNGEVLFSVELDSDAILELPLPIELPPDLKEGAYAAAVTVFQDKEEIASNNSIFFFVKKEYQIRFITAYPQIFYPGGRGLVIANLDIPENSNPYLRWSVNEVEIYSGLFAAGADKLQLEVPDTEGVYSIRLEVFPFEPGGHFGGSQEEQSQKDNVLPSFDFSSIISLEAQFFVSRTQGVDEGELGPEKDYYSLFHFRGESIDWGHNGNGAVAVAVGTPILDISRGVFGFRFDGNDGFMVDKVLLPVVDGFIQPFSYSMRFVIDATEGSITQMTDGAGESVFSMGFTDQVLGASLLGTTSSIEPLLFKGDGADLTLTILPDDETIRYLWFIDGVLVGDDLVPYGPVQIVPGGRTLIGGNGGMYGLLDELGVYYRLTDTGAEVDIEVFARAMERIHGSDLVTAEGFDGTELPGGIVYSGKKEAYSIDGGSLFLPAGTNIELSTIPDEFESLVIEVTLLPLGGKDEGTANGEDGDAAVKVPATLVLKNNSDDGILGEFTGDSGVLSLFIESTDKGAMVFHGENTYPIDLVEGGLRVFIENRSENGRLEIQSALVLKNQVQSTLVSD